MESIYEYFVKSSGVSTDSRNITPHTLFFALHGEQFDGNRYALNALEKGASYAVIDNLEVVKQSIGNCSLTYEQYKSRLIECDDTLWTLQLLAAEHRQRLAIPILAITGSNGKTTTKELINRVLGCKYNITATKGNLNNHIGVPLTLLSMDSSTEFGIVEMGASSCGEIELLSAITSPNFGIITNIGRAHLDGFVDEDGVMRGKGELCDNLASHNGIIFYLESDPKLQKIIANHPNMESIPFNEKLAAKIKSHLEGEYNRYNIAAAVAIGKYFDIDDHLIAGAIESYTPNNNRSQRINTESNTLIVDCYNANPSSMEVALDNLEQITGELKDRWVILGDMLELGTYSNEEHIKVMTRVINSEKITGAYFVGGEFMKCAVKSTKALYFNDCKELQCHLTTNKQTNKLILIKGSRGVGLEQIISLM